MLVSIYDIDAKRYQRASNKHTDIKRRKKSMKTLISILKGIKNGVSSCVRKVKSSKRLQGALALVCVMAIAFGIWFGGYSKGSEKDGTIQKTVVNYQDIEKISFQEATSTEVGVIHKPIEVWGHEVDNPLTTSNCVFTYNITVKAGYDLKDIKDDGGNELTQTITVTLPKATVYEPYVDEDSFTKYWDDEKMTANIGVDDIHAKVVITDYIHSLNGYENYNVVFNEEA